MPMETENSDKLWYFCFFHESTTTWKWVTCITICFSTFLTIAQYLENTWTVTVYKQNGMKMEFGIWISDGTWWAFCESSITWI